MLHTRVSDLSHASGLMSLRFRSAKRVLGTRGVCSLYQRGLRVASCIPCVNDEWDPPVMKHDLLVQSSKREARVGEHADERVRIRRRE
jgi:hypothetical protein